MNPSKPGNTSRSVIVRLPEEEYRFLQTAASRRRAGTVASAVQLCISWMLSNLETSDWDDVLRRPAQDQKSKGPLARPERRTQRASDRSVEMDNSGEEQPIEVVVLDDYPDDRRSARRYSMQMGVELRGDGDAASRVIGTTVNISSHGVLLWTADPIEPDAPVRVTVRWPLLSRSGRPLHIWSRGRTVWRYEALAGVRVEQWEFCEAVEPRESVV